VRTLTTELLLDAQAELAEGPFWDAATERLLWVDILPGVVHRCDDTGGRTEDRAFGPTVGAAVPRATGGLVLAAGDGFVLLDEDGEVERRIPVEADRPGTRMNDAACDPAGRLWAGSMVEDQSAPDAALYRLDADGTVARVLTGITVSNGTGWSPDGSTMYYVDSPTGGVDRFDFDVDAGTLRGRRRLADVPTADGDPDGLCVDETGCLWVAVWGAGQVRRYTPDGALDTIVEVPATQTTSCAFGGPGLRQLFITTARVGLTAQERAEQPYAGALFVCEPGTAGSVTPTFAG
jgi:sugar lactone lactonase YvrE